MRLKKGPWGLYDQVDHCWMSTESHSPPAVFHDKEIADREAVIMNERLGFTSRITAATIDLRDLQFKDEIVPRGKVAKVVPDLRLVE